MENLETELRAFIEEELLFDRKGLRLDPDERLLDKKIIDSMALVQLIAHLEETYGISIDDQELTLDHFQSIRRMAEFVRRKRSTAA